MSDTEIHVWCNRCWESIALPRITEFAVGAVSIEMIQAACERQEFKEFMRMKPKHIPQEAVLAYFLDRRNPACCLLGAETVKSIINATPLKGGNDGQS